MAEKINKKSPLKAKPLRNPGQSIDEQIDKVLFDDMLVWWVMAVLCLVIAGLEWYRWYQQLPYSPLLYSVLALVVSGIAVRKVIQARGKIELLKQGRDGERVVGQFLEKLRAEGYQVFHDVIGDGFNIDHVLIGPGGVYSIETKTYSKPIGRSPVVVVANGSVTVDGQTPIRNPVVQIKAQANWLSLMLEESTGRKFGVWPVLLFPGWYVPPHNEKGYWVLEPKALKAWLSREAAVLSSEEIHLVSFHLSRLIRGT